MEGHLVVVVGVAGGDGEEEGADGRRQRQVDAQTQRQGDARQEVDQKEPRQRRAAGPRQFHNGHDQHVGRQPRRVRHHFGTFGTC